MRDLGSSYKLLYILKASTDFAFFFFFFFLKIFLFVHVYHPRILEHKAKDNV